MDPRMLDYYNRELFRKGEGLLPAAILTSTLLLTGCETTNMASRLTNLTAIQQGGGTNNTTTGAAGGDASTGASTQLESAIRRWARWRWWRTSTPAGTPFFATNTACHPRPTCCA